MQFIQKSKSIEWKKEIITIGKFLRAPTKIVKITSGVELLSAVTDLFINVPMIQIRRAEGKNPFWQLLPENLENDLSSVAYYRA